MWEKEENIILTIQITGGNVTMHGLLNQVQIYDSMANCIDKMVKYVLSTSLFASQCQWWPEYRILDKRQSFNAT